VYSLLVPSAASITRWPGLEGFEVYPTGEAFANYDFIYQGGSIDRPGDEDVSAYFLCMPIWVSMSGNFV